MDKLQEFARKWIAPSGASDQVIQECAQDLYDTIMAATDMGRSQHVHRPTTHSQEEGFAEEQRELEREAAETESPHLGKGGNVIQPAEPLRVMPKNNQWVWVVSFEEPNEAIYPVAHQFDRDCVISINLFQAGLCFPDSEAGKLGAERRAKQGILPPQPTQPAPASHSEFDKDISALEDSLIEQNIPGGTGAWYFLVKYRDRVKPDLNEVPISEFQEDLNQLWTEAGKAVSVLELYSYVLKFIDKYSNAQPAPGVFVPESEIEKLSIAVDRGYLFRLPFIIRSFLKAIDRKKDSDG